VATGRGWKNVAGKMTLDRRRALTSIAALGVMAHWGARAQTAQTGQAGAWPTRPVRIIVPVAAGTATDLTARIFGEKLSVRWGQGIAVENKPGADGLIALGAFVSGRDDHTLLFSFSTAVSLNPQIHAKLPYDAAVDLVPITTTTEVLFAIGVSSTVPVASIADLVAFARDNPGKLNWAAAPGLPRFVLERFLRERGLDLAYVGYNQTGSAVQDLGEGRLQVMIAAVNTLLPVIENKKAKLLLIASTERAQAAATVPHAVEAAHPTLAIPAIGCAYGWKGMPTALRDRLAADIDAVAQDAVVVTQLGNVGQIVRRSNPAALAVLLVEQRVALAPLAEVMRAAK
jgi:tripartite-type tricarboxylate transporter receptor subunit TctC